LANKFFASYEESTGCHLTTVNVVGEAVVNCWL